MAVPEVRKIPVQDTPLENGAAREPIRFPTQFQPLEAPVTTTLSPRVVINRAIFSEVVRIRRARREVWGWERDVQLENGRIHRRDEVLDSLDHEEAVAMRIRGQLLAALAE
jgi:hypothetical protein